MTDLGAFFLGAGIAIAGISIGCGLSVFRLIDLAGVVSESGEWRKHIRRAAERSKASR